MTFAEYIQANTTYNVPGESPWTYFRKAMANFGLSAEELQNLHGFFKKPEKSPSSRSMMLELHSTKVDERYI